MNKMKIKWNWKGFDEVRKSRGVTNLCREVATNKYGSISGIEGYVLEERNYTDRNGFVIRADEYPAIADNLKNNTLAKLV